MHSNVYKFFSGLEQNYSVENLKVSHFQKDPVPFTFIDNFLPADIFTSILDEIKNIPKDNYTAFSSKDSHRQECRNFVDSPLLHTVANSFHSSSFLHWIEKITGVERLIPDPHLRGGGLTRTLSNNKLGLHTDFNWNDQLRLNRKVNLILYLTPDWQSEWNGDLELWDQKGTKCVAKIEPKANRLAFWNYETWLLHGHSNKLEMPNDVSRDNLIHFYYTSNATWEEDPRRSQFL